MRRNILTIHSRKEPNRLVVKQFLLLTERRQSLASPYADDRAKLDFACRARALPSLP